MEEPWILAEQEAQLADRQRKRRPVCADCGRRIAKGWAFELDKGGIFVREMRKAAGGGDLTGMPCRGGVTRKER